MAIQSFEFDAERSAAFAAFRDELYRDDRNWVVSPRPAFLNQFAPEFWFYRRPGNRHRHFVATANGKIAGHVAALVNADLRDTDGTSVGSLGFFECVDDYAAAAELLGHATDWLAREHHLQRIWAPVNFDIWHGYRLMIRGFAAQTFFGEPYNKSYYPEFFSRFGFSVKKTWDTLERQGHATLEKMVARFEPRYRRLIDEKYRFISIDVSAISDLRQLHSVLVRSYSVLLGATPFEFASFERLLGQYLQAFAARFVNLVYDPGGSVAAFGVAYPDYSDVLRSQGNQTGQSSKRPLASQRGATDRAILYMIGATPEEVQRRHGLGSAIYYHTMQQILAAGYQDVLIAIVADDSGARGLLGAEMRSVQRSYALYELSP